MKYPKIMCEMSKGCVQRWQYEQCEFIPLTKHWCNLYTTVVALLLIPITFMKGRELTELESLRLQPLSLWDRSGEGIYLLFTAGKSAEHVLLLYILIYTIDR